MVIVFEHLARGERKIDNSSLLFANVFMEFRRESLVQSYHKGQMKEAEWSRKSRRQGRDEHFYFILNW
jgi:hypothetical protein